MNWIECIKADVDQLPSGEHNVGLRSVLRHIDAAHNHLARGQDLPDEALFTDAVYRTNQAFEGSIKEAYRVLAAKDPSHEKPYKIEKYLEENQIFRPRVLLEFTRYRQEWRNPSTHDYNLDFNDDEAFLAIVSVTAFAKLLIKQISERLSYKAVEDSLAKDAADIPELEKQLSFKDQISVLIQQFLNVYAGNHTSVQIQNEAQLVGALAAYITAADPALRVLVEAMIKAENRQMRADLLVERGQERLVIEVKRTIKQNPRSFEMGLQQLESYMHAIGTKSGVLLMHMNQGKGRYTSDSIQLDGGDLEVIVIRPG